MTNEIINEMERRINNEIAFAYMDYKIHGATAFYDREISKIWGMISILRVATGKQYTFNENGLQERAQA